MINFKKIDEKDIVFVSKTLSEKEDKAFSIFLKRRKSRRLKNVKNKKPKIVQK